MMDNDGRIDESIERFIKELRKPFDQQMFSEDELVYVYDLAGDANNKYLQREALFLGARLYPRSIRLLERRALAYYDEDYDAFRSFMDDHPELSSNLFDILRLALICDAQGVDACEEAADRLLKEIKFDDDEEAIRFIDVAVDNSLMDWLITNYETFKAKAAYLPTVLYEYGLKGTQHDELIEVGIKALEQLTEEEAFVNQYWNLLAVSYIYVGKFDDALKAVEYALAIEPDNEQSLRIRFILVQPGGNQEEIREAGKKLIALGDLDNQTAAHILVNEDTTEGIREILDLFQTHNTELSTFFLKSAIVSEYPDIAKLLEIQNNLMSLEDWFDLVDYADRIGHNNVVLTLFETFEKLIGSPLPHNLFEMLTAFENRDYRTAITVYASQTPESSLALPKNLITGFSTYVVSLLRLGDFEAAKHHVTEMLKLIEEDPDMPGDSQQKEIMADYLETILKKLRSKRKTNWDNFSTLQMILK